MPRTSSSARRYAEAAFQLAVASDDVATWRGQLDAAADVLSDPRLERILVNPALAAASREEVAREALGHRVGPGAWNLVRLLIHRGRVELLPRIATEFHRLDDRRAGISTATATSAEPLDDAEQRALIQRLEAITGGEVRLTTAVD
ncbi:MAG TPA: ATP synthase F1 subunit delta, partial [Candidatus Limnocylindrales bacterium]|nr:ATP synthase F1 subunit delta [Candidatus Limnocylindrales bacterium]